MGRDLGQVYEVAERTQRELHNTVRVSVSRSEVGHTQGNSHSVNFLLEPSENHRQWH